ncbi:GNAT family N-acetyltransferase [Parasulfitobacter algicola]|uniref:GNAT family N-acetyltransferase n=1 Tax=Parasulfitobacter algicola TaxID=2614809 RepID=A0ABX2ISB8_9RHOB|nr:GNAT family N-acetyltransferase [Sulfitobacter algicola]NSX53980.1 GNAT family N-acetyltransferase [Sulfitobacter algicola]
MTLTVHIESPLTQDAAILIQGSEAALRDVYTADECFSFTAAELDKPGISFFVARSNGAPVGCVALCAYETYGEIKRLYVDPTGRGLGIAKTLMAALETHAKDASLDQIKLETGDKLAAAVALYGRLGYKICGPFGDYSEHPASLFMEKSLI